MPTGGTGETSPCGLILSVWDRLFETGQDRRLTSQLLILPLAVRMRPRRLEELVGQEHVLGEGSALRTAIESGHPHSAILYGPPGAGKTTLARIAAAGAEGAFEEESAVNAGRAEIRAVIERARERRQANGRQTVLFLDEIHRFNKAQQDALLPAVEEGLLTLIGATTENPYFEVNSALLSRCQVYELQPLQPEQVEALLRRALSDPERGIAEPPQVEEAALEMLAHRSGGDARVALSALERAVERAQASSSTSPLRSSETTKVPFRLAEHAPGGHKKRFPQRAGRPWGPEKCHTPRAEGPVQHLAMSIPAGEAPYLHHAVRRAGGAPR